MRENVRKSRLENSIKGQIFGTESRKFKKARKLVEQRKYGQAQEIIENLIEANERDVYYCLIGKIHTIRGRNHLACAAYEKAIELGYKGDTEMHRNFAIANGKMYRHEQSIKQWSNFFKLANDKEISSEDYFKYGNELRIVGNKEEADHYLNLALDHDDNKNLNNVYELYKVREEWQVVVELLEAEMQVNPSSKLKFKLASSYFYTFDYLKSEELLIELYKEEKQQKYLVHLIRVYENLEDFESAAQIWDKLELSNFKNKKLYLYRKATALYKVGRYEEASELYISYGQLFADKIEVENEEGEKLFVSEYYHQGLKAEEAGEYETAKNAYQSAIYDTENHEPILFKKLGQMLVKLGKYELACEQLKWQKTILDNSGMTSTPLKKESFRRNSLYTEIFENMSINKDVVLYCSYNGANFSGSPYAIFKKLNENKNLVHIIALSNGVEKPNYIENMDNVHFVTYNSFGHMQALSIAKKIVVDSTVPFYFIPKAEQTILNTWHGTPLKKLGYEMNELGYFASRNVRKSLDIATHFINPNQFTEDVMTKSYTLDTDGKTKFKVTGYPRQDLMINASEERQNQIREYLGIKQGEKVVLYAPTFRGNNNKSNNYTDPRMKKAISKMKKSKEYSFLYKGHYFEKDTDRRLMNIDSNELLSIVDVLITDYSSICIDFLAMNKPILYFAFDLDEYKAERGMYFELAEISDYITNDYKQLVSMVSEQVNNPVVTEKQENARVEYCSLDDGKATERVIEFMNDTTEKETLKKKKEILIYSGNIFLTNGITRAFENLVTAIDKDKYKITVVITDNLVKNVEGDYDILDRLYEQGYMISIKYYNDLMTLRENYARNKHNQINGFYNESHKEIYLNIQRRTAQRLFGNKVFDAVINYESGYTTPMHALFAVVPTKSRFLVLHNDLLGEAEIRFPHLRKTFGLYDQYDYIWTVSEAVNQENIAKIGKPFEIDLHKFGVLNNVIDYKSIWEAAKQPLELEEDNKYFTKGSTVFISVGRLSPEKNQALAVESFAKVMEETGDTNMQLLILGIGPMEMHTQNLINKLNLQDNVHLLGIRSNPFAYLQKSDAFVFPSLHEGQPLVLFEALLTDTPIITSDIPPNVEFVNKYGGVYTEKTLEAFSGAMLDFVEGRMDTSNTYDPVAYNNNILDSLYEKIELDSRR